MWSKYIKPGKLSVNKKSNYWEKYSRKLFHFTMKICFKAEQNTTFYNFSGNNETFSSSYSAT